MHAYTTNDQDSATLGTYAKNLLPIERIYFAADYVYGTSVTSAIAAAKDAVANFT